VLSVHPTARTHSKTPVPHSSLTLLWIFPLRQNASRFLPPLLSSRLVALRVSDLSGLLGSFSPVISSNVSRSKWRRSEERARQAMADAQGQTDSNAEYPQDGKTPKHETLKGIRGGDKHQARSASQPSDRAPGRPRFKIRSSLLSFRVCMPKVPWQLRHYIILFCRNVEIFK